MKRVLPLALLAIVVLSIALSFALNTPPVPIPTQDSSSQLLGKTLPPFDLTDQNQTPVNLDSLRGKVWVTNLMFATCPGICLQLGKHMQKIDAHFPKPNDLRIVSLSINPENDTPAVLKEYAQKLNASPRWLFLTGSRDQIVKLANQGLFLSAGTPEVLTHSEKFVLIDRKGALRGFFDGENPKNIPTIIAAIEKLLQEP